MKRLTIANPLAIAAASVLLTAGGCAADPSDPSAVQEDQTQEQTVPATPAVEQPAAEVLTPSTQPAAASVPAVLILPFHPLGDVAGHTWIGQAIEQNLLTDLTQSRSAAVAVPATQPAVPPEMNVESALQAGRAAHASLVVFGTYQVSEPDVRIFGQVLDTGSGRVVGALKVTGKLDQALALEDQLADQLKQVVAQAPPPAQQANGPTQYDVYPSYQSPDYQPSTGGVYYTPPGSTYNPNQYEYNSYPGGYADYYPNFGYPYYWYWPPSYGVVVVPGHHHHGDFDHDHDHGGFHGHDGSQGHDGHAWHSWSGGADGAQQAGARFTPGSSGDGSMPPSSGSTFVPISPTRRSPIVIPAPAARAPVMTPRVVPSTPSIGPRSFAAPQAPMPMAPARGGAMGGGGMHGGHR